MGGLRAIRFTVYRFYPCRCPSRGPTFKSHGPTPIATKKGKAVFVKYCKHKLRQNFFTVFFYFIVFIRNKKKTVKMLKHRFVTVYAIAAILLTGATCMFFIASLKKLCNKKPACTPVIAHPAGLPGCVFVTIFALWPLPSILKNMRQKPCVNGHRPTKNGGLSGARVAHSQGVRFAW